jgi:hypothetical protein
MVNVQRTPPIVAVPQTAAALPVDANRFVDDCNGHEALSVHSVHSAAAAEAACIFRSVRGLSLEGLGCCLEQRATA